MVQKLISIVLIGMVFPTIGVQTDVSESTSIIIEAENFIRPNNRFFMHPSKRDEDCSGQQMLEINYVPNLPKLRNNCDALILDDDGYERVEIPILGTLSSPAKFFHIKSQGDAFDGQIGFHYLDNGSYSIWEDIRIPESSAFEWHTVELSESLAIKPAVFILRLNLRTRTNIDCFAFSEDKSLTLPTSIKVPDDDIAIWSVNWMEKILPETLPSATMRAIEIITPPGEVEPSSFAIWTKYGAESVNIEINGTDENPVDPEWFDVGVVRIAEKTWSTNSKREEIYYSVPEWIDDFEIESLNARETKQFWINAHPPKDINAGTYTGNMKVVIDGFIENIPLQLKIVGINYDRSFSKSFSIGMRSPFIQTVISGKPMKMTGYGEISVEMARKIVEREISDIADHGVTTGGVVVAIFLDNDMNLMEDKVNWYLGLLKKYELDSWISVGAHTIHERFSRRDPDTADEQYKAVVQRFISLLEENGFKDYAILVVDEIQAINEDRISTFIKLANLLKELPNPPLIYCTTTAWALGEDECGQANQHYDPRASELADVRCYNGKRVDQRYEVYGYDEYVRDAGIRNQNLTSYYNMHPQSGHPEIMRAITGLYTWVSPFENMATWTYRLFSGSPWSDHDNSRGWDVLFSYPDPVTLEPRESLRWVGYREGVEDTWLLLMVEELANNIDSDIAENAREFISGVRHTLLNRIGPELYPIVMFTPPSTYEYYREKLYYFAEKLVSETDS